jgi:hypothetical protein
MNKYVSQFYESGNDIFGEPQEYKKIKFYPIKIKDKKYVDLFYNLFTYPKNSLSDIQVIMMTYLKFLLLSKIYPDIEKNILLFMQHITKSANVRIESAPLNPKSQYYAEQLSIRMMIDEIEITESEFEDVREIILEQNGLSIDYVNEYDQDLEGFLMAFSSFNKIDYADEIFTLSALFHKSPSEIGEYTLYQMQNMMNRISVIKQYDILKPLEVSGAIKMKAGHEVQPFLFHNEKKKRYDSILVKQEDFVAENQDALPGLK